MRKKDGAFIALFKDDRRDQIFLVRRSDWPIWVQPGGGIEPEETPEKAVIRESFEETGFRVKILKKVGIYEVHNPKTNEVANLTHLFTGRIISGSFQREFPGCQGEWFRVNNLPVDITDRTRQKIIDALGSGGKEFYKQAYPPRLMGNLLLLFRHPFSALKFFFRS